MIHKINLYIFEKYFMYIKFVDIKNKCNYLQWILSCSKTFILKTIKKQNTK